MSDSLLREKIKEALIATGNSRHDAHKLLLTWAVRDPVLLLAMTKPHLKAISTGLVDHYMRERAGGSRDDGPDNLSPDVLGDIAASGTTSGRRKASNVPPPKSTERQASTMRRLAAAFTKKKKDE